MKIFADHCVGNFFIEPLRRAGFDILRASDVSMERAADEEIFNFAVKEKRTLISFDRDFINIARFDIKSSAGLIVFEIDRLIRETIQKRIFDFIKNGRGEEFNGRLFVVDLAGRVHIWPKK